MTTQYAGRHRTISPLDIKGITLPGAITVTNVAAGTVGATLFLTLGTVDGNVTTFTIDAEGQAALAAALPRPSWLWGVILSALALQPLVDDLTARIQALGAERDDLIILVNFMAADDYYTDEDIALAVERPWKYESVLTEAKAALTGRDES